MNSYREVNHIGIKQIEKILLRFCHSPDKLNIESAAHEYANEVDYKLSIGNPPSFELEAKYTISGFYENHELDDNCIDTRELES